MGSLHDLEPQIWVPQLWSCPSLSEKDPEGKAPRGMRWALALCHEGQESPEPPSAQQCSLYFSNLCHNSLNGGPNCACASGFCINSAHFVTWTWTCHTCATDMCTTPRCCAPHQWTVDSRGRLLPFQMPPSRGCLAREPSSNCWSFPQGCRCWLKTGQA